MKTIWKFQLESQFDQVVQMPVGAKILTVQLQYDIPTLWAVVDPDQPLSNRHIVICPTGGPAPEGEYIGTFQTGGGTGVWHVFEV